MTCFQVLGLEYLGVNHKSGESCFFSKALCFRHLYCCFESIFTRKARGVHLTRILELFSIWILSVLDICMTMKLMMLDFVAFYMYMINICLWNHAWILIWVLTWYKFDITLPMMEICLHILYLDDVSDFGIWNHGIWVAWVYTGEIIGYGICFESSIYAYNMYVYLSGNISFI